MSQQKLYKIIKNNASCHGGNFDWTPYLPKNGKKGKWTPRIKDISECSKGYHITEHWNMWYKDGCKIYECEAKGILEKDAVGVNEKVVCESVRLIKEVVFEFDEKSNTGHRNTGNRNTGNRNTGNRNTGDSNTGDSNTGHWNTGYSNTGNWNTGNRNTGHWNTGHRNTGSLNTIEPETVYLFNKPILYKKYKEISFPSYFYFELLYKGYKESWKDSFKDASKQEAIETIELPNFDYAVFEEITGITKQMLNKKIK